MNKIAPVLLVFGQSNAHASGVKLGEEEKIRVPLKHVKVLPRIPNQAFSPDRQKTAGSIESECHRVFHHPNWKDPRTALSN